MNNESKMLAKVSNGEFLQDLNGLGEKYKGPGTLTSDSITKMIPTMSGILQPMNIPSEYRSTVKRAIDIVDEADSEYRKAYKVGKDLRGTGSITRRTDEINEQNRLSTVPVARSVNDWAFEVQHNKYEQERQEQIRQAKCGKDLPGFETGKPKNIFGITPEDMRKIPGMDTRTEFDKQVDQMNPEGFKYTPETVPTRSTAWGGIGNAIASGLTALGGLSLILGARNQSLNSPTTYAPNQYERQALTAMANRRASVYPQLQAMRDTEARNRWAIRNSGGLTGAQKYLANVASGIGLQRNYASVIDAANQLNNQYRGEWANMASNIGTQNAQRLQNSNQYRDEAYAKAHGARTQMEQMGMFNVLNAIQQFYANEFKRHQFERTMGLYDQDYRYNKSIV